MAITLHQFRGSHFNEKARWALAWKQLDHRRICYLPGPHRAAIRKLTGQTATPVIDVDGEVVAGSAAIIDCLERRFPERPLYPSNEAERDKALAIQTRFDTEVGPAARAAVFSVILDYPGYVTRVFASGEPAPSRVLYRLVLPLVRGVIARANDAADPARVALAMEKVDRALDWLAGETRERPYLAGDSFTVADLSAAALLSPVASVVHPDVARPPPVPESLLKLLARWNDHPAIGWVRKQYALHRPPA
jgi:glutathione S-transferase